jgi:hypothetical protein
MAETEHSPTSSPRKSIGDRSVRGVSIQIVKNQYPRLQPRIYRLVTIEKLLDDSMQILNLNSLGQKVFKADGTPVKTVDEVQEHETLYVSSGEPFGFGMPSAAKRRSPPTSPPPPLSKKKEPTPSPPKPPPTILQREFPMFHRVVALSKRTTNETMRESTAAVYAGLTDSQKVRLETANQGVQKIHDDTQHFLFIHHLLRQLIGPRSIELLPETTAWAMNLLKGLSLEDIRLVISGPRQSGKTTLLYELASVLARKLQVSDEASQWLLFPLNFEICSPQLNGHERLLRLFVSVAFQSLEYSCLKLLPYLDLFRKWFVLSAFGAAMPWPKELEGCPFLDAKVLAALTHSLSQALTANGDDSLSEFIGEVCAFPHKFAVAVGLKGALFVLDGFEYTRIEFEPAEDCFDNSLRPVCLSDVLSLALNESPYIVSLKNEREFLECFAASDAALLATEGIVHEAKEPVILVRNPPFQIRVEDCAGCPGYLVMFRALVKKIKAATDNAAYPSNYSDISTACDMSRQKVIRLELVHFATLLNGAGNEAFSQDLINDLSATTNLQFAVGADPDAQVPPPPERKF